MQEFVYDAFWAKMTPDREFPAEVRRLCNGLFGSLAVRARKVDTRALLLRDMTDLFIETLELYRDTRDSVGAEELEKMTPLARDRALRLEMRAEGNLHPALYSNESHYEVLKQLADGVLALMLDVRDYDRPILRSATREILLSAILKPCIQFLMPVFFNRLAVQYLEGDFPEPDPEAEVERLEGEQALEQRAAATAQAEAGESRMPAAYKHKHLRNSASIEAVNQGRAGPAPTPGGSALDRGHDSPSPARGPLGGNPSRPAAGKPEPLPPGPARAGSGSAGREEIRRQGGAGDASQEAMAPDGPRSEGAPSPGPSSESARTKPGRADASERAGNSSRGQKRMGRRNLEREATGFQGRPFTNVVAAELNNERRSREYVVFNIRVNDDAREWTVLRRFRNFEQLHRRLRGVHGFAGSLPPKRYFFHSNSWAFVEERREQLDLYLKCITSDPEFCRCDEVFDFLNPWSSAYALDNDASLLHVVSSNLDHARHNVKSRVKGARRRPRANAGPAAYGELIDEGQLTGSSSRARSEAAHAIPHAASEASMASMRETAASSPTGSSARALGTSLHGGPPSEQSYGQPERAARRSSSGSHAPHLLRSTSDGELIKEGNGGSAPSEHSPQGADDPGGAASGVETTGPVDEHSEEEDWEDGREHSGGSSSVPAAAAPRALDSSFEDESIGISRPLYYLADAVFELQTHGFIWRQVTVVVKQMLSLVAGGTVDLFIAQRLHDVSSSHTIARLLLRLRNILWPGGVWFATARARVLAEQGKPPPPSVVPPGGFSRDDWFKLEMETALEDAEMANRLKDILLNRAKPSLVRIVGRTRYFNAVNDIYNILQSPTYMMQLAHGILEIIFIHLMPELKPLLDDIRSPPASRHF